jgi:hypothetical protein
MLDNVLDALDKVLLLLMIDRKKLVYITTYDDRLIVQA